MTDLESIVAMKRLGKLAGPALVSWAVSSLSRGLDSEHLRSLAGLDLSDDVRTPEAEEVFLAAVDELGLHLPPEEAAIRAYVRHLAQEIVDGAVAPQEQVARINREVVSPLNHPKDLMAWCYVEDGVCPEEWSLAEGSVGRFREIPKAGLASVNLRSGT
jgi:hypothetical protein